MSARNAERVVDAVMGSLTRPPGRTAAARPAPALTEADHAAIAAKIVEAMKPAPIPLHEMSDMERDAFANEVWARAGIIGGKTK